MDEVAEQSKLFLAEIYVVIGGMVHGPFNAEGAEERTERARRKETKN